MVISSFHSVLYNLCNKYGVVKYKSWIVKFRRLPNESEVAPVFSKYHAM